MIYYHNVKNDRINDNSQFLSVVLKILEMCLYGNHK